MRSVGSPSLAPVFHPLLRSALQGPGSKKRLVAFTAVQSVHFSALGNVQRFLYAEALHTDFLELRS